jgi:hypothetical protein
MRKETFKAAAWGTLFTLIVAGLIVLGSRNLAHFDAALVGYTLCHLRHHPSIFDLPAGK